MSFMYQQIGLNIDRQSRVSAYYIINQIITRLRDYSDNGPIPTEGPGRISVVLGTAGRAKEIRLTLEILAKNKLLVFNTSLGSRSTNHSAGYNIFVTNRYKLELLRAELKWLAQEEDERTTMPIVDSIVYYDVATGEIFINGVHKTLKKRNKKLLDALFTASPDYVPRTKLVTIARSENKYSNEPSKVRSHSKPQHLAPGASLSVVSLCDDPTSS